MPEPYSPVQSRNYLDDILDQAYNDLELERQRQANIINAPDPAKRLGEIQKVEKQVATEAPEIQDVVRKKTYTDTSYYTGGDYGKRERKEKAKEKEVPFDQLYANYVEYEKRLADYTQKEYGDLVHLIGQQKASGDYDVIRGPFDKDVVTYTDEDVFKKAQSQAKERLVQEGLLKPKRTGLTALKETFTDYKKFGSKLPWIGGGVEAQEAFSLINAIRDAQNGVADEDDYRILIEAQMEMERDSDWSNMAVEIFLTLPGYAVEFASTGGTATAVRTGTKKAILDMTNWILTKQGKKLIKEGAESFGLKAISGIAGTTAGAIGRTANIKTWNRTLSNTANQMIPDYELNNALEGKIEVTAGEFKDWGEALGEGIILTTAENLGEEFGEVFSFGAKELRAFLKTNPESSVSGLIKAIIRKNPNVQPGKIMQAVRQAGIHSVPVEILEERVTDVLKSGVEGHEFRWPTPEEWLAEVVAIGGFAGSTRGIGAIVDKSTKNKQDKARRKVLDAIETGQLRTVTDNEITDFLSSLTEEEAMEVGFDPKTSQFEINSALGGEVVRRDLDLDKVPETTRELREGVAKKRIVDQQKEGKDFVGALINKVGEEAPNIEIQEDYLGRTVADEIEDEGWTEEQTKQFFRDHGVDENSDPNEFEIFGRSEGGGVIRISRAGTPERMADEYVAVQEEMAEEYYKAEQTNNPEFENEITEERRKYHEATGEADTGESNLEWFSSKAIHFATQGEVHKSIGAKLRDIFNRFIENARKILKDAIRLRKAINEGKVSESLLKKLEEATDFKKVGERVAKAQATETKSSYRTAKAPVSLSNQKYGQIKRLMYQLTEEGEPAKYWYEQSGQALLEITNGDKDLAKKLLSIIAITSPRMDVKTNFGQMIKGYYKVLLGEAPLAGMFPTAMSKKIQEVMDGKEWKGLKTDKFLKNLVAVIDGGSPDVTVDMWMVRAFGIDKDAPTQLEYNTIEKLVQDIAKDIGWEPYQVQASIWTATKARWEKVYKPMLLKAKKSGLYKDGEWKSKLAEKNFRKRVFKEFKKATITKEEISKSGFNYKDAIDIYKGRISHEVIPHPSSKVLPKIHNATYEQQLEYHYAINGVFSDENGRDIIAGFLGLPEITSFDGPGFYEGASSPSRHTEVLFSQQLKYLKAGQLDQVINEETKSNIELYASIRGLLTRQDAIGFTKEFETKTKKLANAVAVEVDKGLTTEQFQAVYNGMVDAGIDTGPMPTDYGFILVNFMDNDGNPYSNVDNVSFEKIVDDVIENVFENEDIVLNLKAVTSLGSLIENDWSKNKNGENYQARIRKSRRPSSIWELVSTLNGEIQQINERFSQKYGWGNPGKFQKIQGEKSYRIAPTFYSQAKRVSQEKFPNKLASQSVENWLKKNQVKPEEIEWLDIKALTEGKKHVTREELLDWINAHEIVVTDVMKQDRKIENNTRIEHDNDGTHYLIYKDTGERLDENSFDTEQELNEYYSQLEMHDFGEFMGAKHSAYQLPGEKEDYRELLLTLPQIKDEFTQAGHFDEPNILAHIRFNTRYDADGNKVLFIEEIQSDWHSQGREKGYKDKEFTKLPEGWTIWGDVSTTDNNVFKLFDNNKEYVITFRSDSSEKEAKEKRAIEAYNSQKRHGVPNAPFKGTGWIKLVMKRMLRYGAENGFDKIAWTTSKQQVERWKSAIRQNVDTIHWQRGMGFSADDVAYTPVEELLERGGSTHVIINGLKDGKSVFNQTVPIEGETTINGTDVTLDGLLGKRMATQIRESSEKTGTIEGENLTIGGEGFKHIYDNAMVSALNKLSKSNKWGAKVGEIVITQSDEVVSGRGKIVMDKGISTQPSIAITQEMKESVMQGQPTFHMAPTNLVTPLSKIYQEQKGNKKRYTKKDFELDLVKLGYPEETIKTAMDLYGIIRTKQIDINEGEPTAIEQEIAKEKERETKLGNIKSRLNALKRGYRVGSSEAKKEIEKLQKIITQYARENLPKGDFRKSEITGLMAKVRDAKRQKDLAVAMERIDRIVTKVSTRSALSKWNKSIKKKATVKKVSGIVRGKVGADVQDVVNEIRSVHKLTIAEVEHRIELLGEMISNNDDGEPTEAQALSLNILLTYGAIKHKSPVEIQQATEQFDILVSEGRYIVLQEQEAYKNRMLEVVNQILDVITGGAGPQTQAGVQKLGLNKRTLIAEIKEKLSTIDSEQQSIEYIFDKLSRLDKTSKPLESFINQYFMPKIRQARLSEYSGLVEMQKLLKSKAEEIYGIKGRKLTAKLSENTVKTIVITHNNGEEGSQIESELTYNQAYKKWMELQDPTLHPTFEKMGWDVYDTQRQIESMLPKELMEWAKWQLYEFYPMYYQRVNQTFRKRFYVNMPFNPVYSPVSRRVGAKADEGDETLNQSKSPFGSITSAGSLKSRVSNTEELAWVDGDTAIMKHITEMEHFINYTDVMREMRTVFMNRGVSRSISDFHGKGISRILNKFMDDIARGGVDRASNLQLLDTMRGNFSRAVIGANPVVFLKQLASIPAYMADIPTLDWNKEFIKLLSPLEFRRMYRTLSQSEMLKMRYDKGFERDMVTALNNIKPGRMITGANLFNNAMYALTKMGDKQAIFLGGWPVYKYYYKQAIQEGKTQEQAKEIAMKKFESASLRSQQASDVEDLADFQRRGSLAKLFTMFMTSPNQYYRMVAGGYRNLYYKRGSKSENIRKIFVGQFLLPSLFTFISNGFQWEDDEQIMSIFLYPFSGLLFFGQGFEFIIRSAWRKAYPMGTVPVLDFVADWGSVASKGFDGKEFTPEKTLEIIDDFLEGGSKITGIPYGPAKRVAKGIKTVIEGKSKHPIREAVGFRFEKEKKKKKKVSKPIFIQ